MLQPKNICRCCLFEGCYKDISTEYFWSGKKEVYADMLLETFNITISPLEGCGPSSGSRLICDGCIARVRDAAAFKQQVLRAEQNVGRHLAQLQSSEKVYETLIDLKQEKLHYESLDEDDLDIGPAYEDSYTHDDRCSDGLNVSDLDLKDEIDDDAMDNYNKEEGELFVIKLLPEYVKKEKAKSEKMAANKLKRTLEENNTLKTKRTKPKSRCLEDKTPTSKLQRTLKTPINELKMRENTVKLALNSNMCLFKSLRVKYQCFYCKERFFKITQLKEHISSTHTCDKEKSLKVGRASFCKNAEITDLACNLCSEPCQSVESLQEHLTERHGIKFEPVGHLLIPFRIENELKCVTCDANFNTFVRLLIHMNTHYTNHVCETCGRSFINKVSLRVHVASLHKERKCKFCPATFTTNSARYKHIVKIHDQSRQSKRYCHSCNKTFKYTYLLDEHRIKEHGLERTTASCPQCNKVFISPNNLKVHIRSVHLRERNYPCSFCTMRFFTKTDQKRHEKTHGIAEADMITCTYCDAKFKSKDSWRRHVNKQHPRAY